MARLGRAAQYQHWDRIVFDLPGAACTEMLGLGTRPGNLNAVGNRWSSAEQYPPETTRIVFERIFVYIQHEIQIYTL